jgi:uncharacterized protein (DUF4415 family)
MVLRFEWDPAKARRNLTKHGVAFGDAQLASDDPAHISSAHERQLAMNDAVTKKALNPEQLARLQALAAMPEEAIDTADIPEVQDWSGAIRGGLFRPRKMAVTIRLDADLLAFFKSGGRRYQTRINRRYGNGWRSTGRLRELTAPDMPRNRAFRATATLMTVPPA